MLGVQALFKAYARQPALKWVSVGVERPEVVGVLGPAGAGKTTLLKLLAGVLQPDAGSIQIAGIDALAHPQAAQAITGYLPAGAPLYPDLSVQAHLRLVADLRGITPDDQRRWLSQAVYAAGLQDHLTQPARCLSRGQRQRLGLALAMAHRPLLLILDEPLTGLDPGEARAVRDLIRRLGRRSVVLLSTAAPDEAESLCDRVLLLLHGELRADVRPAELWANAGVVLVLHAPVREAPDCLGALAGVRSITTIVSDCGYPAYYIEAAGEADLCPTIFALASERGWPLAELRPDRRSLRGLLTDLAGAPENRIGA